MLELTSQFSSDPSFGIVVDALCFEFLRFSEFSEELDNDATSDLNSSSPVTSSKDNKRSELFKENVSGNCQLVKYPKKWIKM